MMMICIAKQHVCNVATYRWMDECIYVVYVKRRRKKLQQQQQQQQTQGVGRAEIRCMIIITSKGRGYHKTANIHVSRDQQNGRLIVCSRT